MTKFTLCVLVDNQAGVLFRVTSLFSRRGYNIESLAVGETHRPDISRMTIRLQGDERITEQIVEQLRKLYCVRTVQVLPEESQVTRELMMVKVRATSATRGEIIQVASVFRARVVDVSKETMTLELTGEPEKFAALMKLMEDYGILEFARTGALSLERGAHTLYDTQPGPDAQEPV